MEKRVIVIRDDMRRQRALDVIRELKIDSDHLCEVIVKPYKKKRSVEQNARHWAILTQISDQWEQKTGNKYSPETWHEFFKTTFIGKDTIIVDGSPHLISKTSTTLNTMEFRDFDMQIEAWASEHEFKLYFEDYERDMG